MGKEVTLSHDAFGRFECKRIQAEKGQCEWCGHDGRRFQYGAQSDGFGARTHWDNKLFCSKSCRNDYYK